MLGEIPVAGRDVGNATSFGRTEGGEDLRHSLPLISRRKPVARAARLLRVAAECRDAYERRRDDNSSKHSSIDSHMYPVLLGQFNRLGARAIAGRTLRAAFLRMTRVCDIAKEER